MRLATPMLKIALLCLLFPATGISQFSRAWVNTYTTSPAEASSAATMTTDASGNCYITGIANPNSNHAQWKMITIKYNASGVQQWVALYNGPGKLGNGGNAIAVDAAGNVYVTGFSITGTEVQPIDICVTVKYNSAGVRQWEATYSGGAEDNRSAAIAVDATGNVYLTGYQFSGNLLYDYMTLKYNASGVQQWVRTYNDTANGIDAASALALDASGNVYVTGKSMKAFTVPPPGMDYLYDYVTIKYDPNGVVIWQNMYTGTATSSNEPVAIAVDRSGNTYITGSEMVSGTALTIKYGAGGLQDWVRSYHGSGDNAACFSNALTLDPSGNIAITGSINNEFLTLEYDHCGAIRWSAAYNGGAYGYAVDLGADASGNIYTTGTVGLSSPGTEYATVKYSSDGFQDWVATFDGPSDGGDQPASISVINPKPGREPIFNEADVYLTGSSNEFSSGGPNFTTLKYTQSLVLSPFPATAQSQDPIPPGRGILICPVTTTLSNSPDFFRDSTNITYTVPYDGFVSLTVFDMAGKKVATLVETEESAGVHMLPFHAAHLASGIYQYRLVAVSPQGSFSQTKQMTLRR